MKTAYGEVSSFELCVGLATALAMVYGMVAMVKTALSPLRSVPGPFLARFTRLWYLQAVSRGRFEEVNIALHRKHGRVVRVAPDEYSIDDAGAAKMMYGTGSRLVKAAWYEAWDTPKDNLFALQDQKRHSEERRKYAAAYSMSTMVKYESHVDDCIDVLDRKLRQFASSDELIDMGHWMQCYAFDVIGKVTFSKRFGFLDNGDDIGGIIGALDRSQHDVTLAGIAPGIQRLLRLAGRQSDTAQDLQHGLRFAVTAIEERKQRAADSKPEGPTDFATKFLEAHAADARFTFDNVVRGCMVNIGAGSDTTSITLAAILFHTYTTPRVLRRLRHELDAAARQGTVGEVVSFAASQKMPYLQAVIKEGLRIHPATGLPMVRRVPQGGATMAGHYFPEGSTVGVNAWVAHRSHVFAPDPDTFRPERWIADGPEDKLRISAMDHYFMPFGLGSRTCIGKNISYLEINKLIPHIVRQFDLDVVSGNSTSSINTMKSRNVWFVKQTDFRARISPRRA